MHEITNTRIWLFLTLAGILVSGCTTHREIDRIVEGVFNPIMEINLVAVHFFYAEGRWPRSKEEFLHFVEERRLPFSPDQLQDLTFNPQDDGSLVVSYRQLPPNEGNFQITIGPPIRNTSE